MSEEKIHDIEIELVKVCESNKSSHKRISGLEGDVKNINNKVQTNIESIGKTNILLEGLINTVSEVQESVKSINQLAYSVHEIATEMKAMRTDINRGDIKIDGVAGRVKIIEEKPAKKYDAIVEKIILVVVGGIVGFFLMKMGM